MTAISTSSFIYLHVEPKLQSHKCLKIAIWIKKGNLSNISKTIYHCLMADDCRTFFWTNACVYSVPMEVCVNKIVVLPLHDLDRVS